MTWVPQVLLNLKSVELASPKRCREIVRQKGRPARAGLFAVSNLLIGRVKSFYQLVVDKLSALRCNLSDNFFGVSALATGVCLSDVSSND